MAIDLAAQVEATGAQVIGPAHSLEQALRLAETDDIDFAILDVNLRGVQSLPVARRLQERGVPFVFLTGYDNPKITEDFGEAKVIAKPISSHALKKVLASPDQFPDGIAN